MSSIFQHDSNYMGVQIPDHVWRERMPPSMRHLCVLNVLHYKVDCLANIVEQGFARVESLLKTMSGVMTAGVSTTEDDVEIPESAHVCIIISSQSSCCEFV
jgi:hypothetical protein